MGPPVARAAQLRAFPTNLVPWGLAPLSEAGSSLSSFG